MPSQVFNVFSSHQILTKIVQMAKWVILVDVVSLFELKLSQSLLFSILGWAIFLSKISKLAS